MKRKELGKTFNYDDISALKGLTQVSPKQFLVLFFHFSSYF